MFGYVCYSIGAAGLFALGCPLMAGIMAASAGLWLLTEDEDD